MFDLDFTVSTCAIESSIDDAKASGFLKHICMET